jgi:hypothetical protein
MYLHDSGLTTPHQSTTTATPPQSNLAGLGEDCTTACLALKSMQRSADAICRMEGSFSLACMRAKMRVLNARARIFASGCSCSEQSAPPSEPPAGVSGYGLGQLPQRRRLTLLPPGTQLRMPPYETIYGFGRDVVRLTAAQIERVNRVADFVARSWTGTSPIMSIRLAGYINADEFQAGLGAGRATAVRDALISALNGQRPGVVTRINWTVEDRGFSPASKVDIFLWAGATPPPVPPLVRVPSPAEAARSIVPLGPETAEQRIQRILRELPPAPPPRRSFNQMFWRRVDESLDSTMSRLNIPRSLRPHIRNGVHAAITRGSEALLNEIVGATRLPSEVQEALRTTTRALLDVPIAR